MPRFRFQWANIPDPIRSELADQLHLPSAAPESFVQAYGVRPKAEFIQQTWTILLDCWLFHDDDAAGRIAATLRAKRNGDPDIDHDMQYLRSCRNASGLRDVVLAEFIQLGERTVDRIPAVPHRLSPTAASASMQAEEPTTGDPLETLSAALQEVLQQTTAGSTLKITSDGDFCITYGSSLVFVRTQIDETKAVAFKIYSCVLSAIPATPALYETLNHINITLPSGRIFAINDMVILESSIPLPAFSPEYLIHTVETVGFISDLLDDRLKATFGGTVQLSVPAADAIDV